MSFQIGRLLRTRPRYFVFILIQLVRPLTVVGTTLHLL
jgi:hypothetical protein